MSTDENEYQFKLAKYLLNYDPTATHAPTSNAIPTDLKIDPRLLKDDQLIADLTDNLHRVRPFTRPSLAGFHSFQSQQITHVHTEREEKYELLEHHHVYDTDLLTSLKEFVTITIALLVKLERMHKKNILCGNINPYTFLYSKKRKHCEPVDLGVILSDKNVVKAEKQAYGPYIYLLSDLGAISYSRYLAPELRESVLAYDLQKRLKDLCDEAKRRNLATDQCSEIDVLLRDFHQKKIRYTNRAEIYSVGYTINQIFSHTLSKLAHTGLRMNEFINDEVDPAIIHEAELLLPDSFANPEDERVFALVNEAVEYIHDLMHEHMELRDSLELSIEKFSSLLKRASVTKPDDILGEEEEETAERELELLLAEEEEHEAHHAHEHEHEHSHDDHGHDDHGHDHGHYDHPHEHDDHGHGDHDEHGHGDHDEHGHGDHDEHGHGDHDEHGHGDHDEHGHGDHADHGHGDHADHDDHGHGDHADHGHDDHADHGHGDHDEHGHGDHDEHGHGDHADHGHGDHDDHGHDDHGHDDHGHDEHGHGDHADHGHDDHAEGHGDSHDDHEGGHGDSHDEGHGDSHDDHGHDDHAEGHNEHDSHADGEHADSKEHDEGNESHTAEHSENDNPNITHEEEPDPRSTLRRPGHH